MAFLASEIVGLVARKLHDEEHTRWPLEEKLTFLNLGQLMVVTYQPQANAQYKALTLGAGARQGLTAPDLKLMSLTRNLAANGVTPGRYVAATDRATLDASLAQWTAPQAVTAIESYTVDARVDGQFFVYPPPAEAGLKVEAVVSVRPATVSIDQPLVLSDIYVGPIMHWMYYMCLAFQLDSPTSAQQAMSHYQLFFTELGVEMKASDLVIPNYREQYMGSPQTAGA